MSGDSYSETTYTSWFSRLGNAFTGILFGIILFGGSIFLLYWNEGRAVDVARGLAEAGGAVVDISADKVDPAHDGKLVHVSGKADTSDTLTDPAFGVSATALRLIRTAEMFQWKEQQKQERRTKLGGGEETVTTYTYVKDWSDSPIDSSSFHSNRKEGAMRHDNPTWPAELRSRSQDAGKVTLGAFVLSPSLLAQIHTSAKVPVGSSDLDKVFSTLRKEFQAHDGRFHRGASPASPEIGDLRVSFAVVQPQTVSVIAEQTRDTFRPYQPKSARRTVDVLHEGDHSAAEMIRTEQSSNARLTWILRLVGFVVMALGIGLVLNPLKVLADVVPFIGSIVGFGVGVIAFLLAAVLSLITIALSWIAVRPVLGISLLAAAGIGIIALVMLSRSRRRVAPAE
jgi:hypothetical protein